MSLLLLLTMSTGFGNDVTDPVLKQWLLIEMMSSALCLTTLEVPSFIVEVFLECDDDWKYGFSYANNSHFRLGRLANCPTFYHLATTMARIDEEVSRRLQTFRFPVIKYSMFVNSCQCYSRLIISKKPLLPLFCRTNSVGKTTPKLLWYNHRLSGKPSEQPLSWMVNLVTHSTRYLSQQLSEVSSQSN